MKKKVSMRCLALTVAFLVAAAGLPLLGGANGESYAASSRLQAPQQVKAVSENEHAVKLSWKKVKKAKGYFVYRYEKSSKKYKKVKTLTARKKSWINSGLETDRVYRYKVRAYRTVKGKNKAGKASYVVSVKPQTKKSKKKNVRRIYMSKRMNGLYPGYQIEMGAEVSPYREVVSKKLRWRSSNPRIVKVSRNGRVTAVRAGKATITARAHNGVQAKCRVKVMNYSLAVNGKTISLGEKISSLNKKLGRPYTGAFSDTMVGKILAEFGLKDKRIKVHLYGASEGELMVIEERGRALAFASTDAADFNLQGIKSGEKNGAQIRQKLQKLWPYTEFYDETMMGELAYYEGYDDSYATDVVVDVTSGVVQGVALGTENMPADLVYSLILM